MKAIIVDDEPKARSILRNIIADYCKGIEVIAEASSVNEAVKIINKQKPDIVFLDIEMPNENGFALFEYFDTPTFETIFCTAYSDYAIKAFEGTVIIVSHDRDFLQGLTNRTFYFRNQTLKEYIGDIEEFLSSLNIDSLQQLEVKQKQNAAQKIAEKNNSAPNDSQQKRNAEKEKKKLENKIQKAEKTIEEMEAAIAVIEKKMADPVEMKSGNSRARRRRNSSKDLHTRSLVCTPTTPSSLRIGLSSASSERRSRTGKSHASSNAALMN